MDSGIHMHSSSWICSRIHNFEQQWLILQIRWDWSSFNPVHVIYKMERILVWVWSAIFFSSAVVLKYISDLHTLLWLSRLTYVVHCITCLYNEVFLNILDDSCCVFLAPFLVNLIRECCTSRMLYQTNALLGTTWKALMLKFWIYDRKLHIASSIISGSTTETIGWNIYCRALCLRCLLHHHLPLQPLFLSWPHLQPSLKGPQEQVLGSAGNGSMQIDSTRFWSVDFRQLIDIGAELKVLEFVQQPSPWKEGKHIFSLRSLYCASDDGGACTACVVGF